MTHTLTHLARPWTLNVERAGNRWKRIQLTKEWRAAFCELAVDRQLPLFDAVHIHVRPTVRNRAAMPDTGACIGAAKAAIDGIVDAGVLEDDGPHQVVRITFHAPEVTGVDSLIIEIEEIK